MEIEIPVSSMAAEAPVLMYRATLIAALVCNILQASDGACHRYLGWSSYVEKRAIDSDFRTQERRVSFSQEEFLLELYDPLGQFFNR